MVNRRKPSARSSMPSTSPISVTMPVNMASAPLEGFEPISAERLAAARAEPRRSGQGGQLQTGQRLDPVGTDEYRGSGQRRPVDEIGCQQRSRHGGAAFDHQPGDAARRNQLERMADIGPAGSGYVRAHHLDPVYFPPAPPVRR